MRKNKTSKENRNTYIYYFNGSTTEIAPDMDGISGEWIALLHDMDDQEHNNNRRQNRVGRHISLNSILSDDNAPDKAAILMDSIVDVEAECLEKATLKQALDLLTPDQREIVRLRVDLDYTQAKIADMLGISEYAVRERISRIKNKLKNLL